MEKINMKLVLSIFKFAVADCRLISNPGSSWTLSYPTSAVCCPSPLLINLRERSHCKLFGSSGTPSRCDRGFLDNFFTAPYAMRLVNSVRCDASTVLCGLSIPTACNDFIQILPILDARETVGCLCSTRVPIHLKFLVIGASVWS